MTRLSPPRRLGYPLLVAAILAVVTACTGGDSDSLVVYSGRSESLVGPIIAQFKEASGIDVAVKYGSTSEMAATLLEEGPWSPADVFFAQDPGGLGAVAQLLAPLSDEMVKLVPAWARSPEKKWVGISGRARTVVYNRQRIVENDLPTSIEELTEPQWRARIGWAPSNASFQAMVTAMRVMWGQERTRQWLQGVHANKPRVYPKNTPIVAAAASGEIDVGLVNHYYLHRFIQENGEGFGARNYFLSDGEPGSLVLVAGAGILETSKNREPAERFLQFMLSRVSQQYFARETFEYPLTEEMQPHRLLPTLSEVNNPDIDMTSLSDVQGTQTLLRELGILP